MIPAIVMDLKQTSHQLICNIIVDLLKEVRASSAAYLNVMYVSDFICICSFKALLYIFFVTSGFLGSYDGHWPGALYELYYVYHQIVELRAPCFST